MNVSASGNVIIIEDNVSRFSDEMKRRLETALEEIGMDAERFAKEKCPVDTGNLRNRTTHRIGESAAYVGTNVEYGPYVEFGTSRQKAQPFLRPAANDHSNHYRNIVKKHLSR